MRTKRFLVVAGVIVLVLAAGCDNHMAAKRDEAEQRWASSRAEMVTNMAQQSYERGNFARAREQLDPILRSGAPYAPAYVLTARLAADEGDLDEARNYAASATQVDGASAEAWYVLGTVEQTLGHHQEALNAFAKAAGEEPLNPRHALAEAEMFVAIGQVDAAERSLAAACDQMPGSAEVHASYGDVLSRLGRYEEAVGQYRIATRLDPENTPFKERMAVALFHSGAFAEAESVLAGLQGSEPEFASGWMSQVRADCLMALRKTDQARALYARVVETSPKAVMGHVGLARCAILQDRLPEALRHLEQVLKERPGHAEANGLLGYVLAATGRPGEAVPHLKLAMQDPACKGRETIRHLLACAEASSAVAPAP
jgi:tetratricopeptide (TPR) repeat protein